jgi:hypothetical protein
MTDIQQKARISLHLFATMCWFFAYVSLHRNCQDEYLVAILELPILFMIGFHPGWITASLRKPC